MTAPCTSRPARTSRRREHRRQSGVALTTGRNDLSGGTDLVAQGRAERVTDGESLQALADAWEGKYGPNWHYDVGEGGFIQRGSPGVWVFRIAPDVAYGFGKGPYSQTRWSF